MKLQEEKYTKAREEVEDASADVAFYDFQLFKSTEFGEEKNLPKIKKQLKQAEERLALAKIAERTAWTSFMVSIP
jgi:hypothetical protein